MKNYLLLAAFVILISCSKKPPRFELLRSDYTGVEFVNEVIATDSLHVMNFEYIYNGAGVGIVDLNNDNLQDIIFTGNQVATRIYLNEGNFKFSDISSSLVGQDSSHWFSGVSIVDINSDGFISEQELIEARSMRISNRIQQGYQMRNTGNISAFQEIDKNTDGKISPEEFSEQQKQHQMRRHQPQ